MNPIESVEGSGSWQLNNLNTTGTITYLQLSNISTTNFTMSMWLKPVIDDTNNFFWQFNNGSYDALTGVYIGMKNSQWDIRINGNPTNNIAGLYPNDGKWHNLIMVYNNGTSTFYIDKGNIYAQSTTINVNSVNNNRLGGASWFSTTERYAALNGYMDDFRFYNRALSTSEISTIYNYVKTVYYTVTVSSGSFYLRKSLGNAILNPTISFQAGTTYVFDQSDSTNVNNQIVFGYASNGNPILGSSDGVTVFGTPGQPGAYTKIVLSSSFTGTLYYYSLINVITFNSILSSTGAKFYYSGDYGVVTDSSGRITTWRNRVSGGVDASANWDFTNASTAQYSQYPTINNSYLTVNFTSPMIRLSGNSNQVGFNYLGGAKQTNDLAETTFVMFWYIIGPNNGGGFSNGQFLAHKGGYGNGAYAIGFNINKLDVVNGGTSYTSLSSFSLSYIMFSVTSSTSGANTNINVRAYPNIDQIYTAQTSTLGTSSSVQYSITDNFVLNNFHNLTIGYLADVGTLKRSVDGTIGEAIYFNRVLTNNELSIIEGKLAWKYNQASMLPITHPYKTISPL